MAAIDTYSRTEPNIVHVTPINDDVEHGLCGFRCVCGPKVEYVDGGWVVVNQALDGRA